MSVRAQLDEAIGLQQRLALPPRYRAERRGNAVVRLAIPDWALHPVIDEAGLRALEVDGFGFPPDLVRLYTQVGDGFRYGGEEFVDAATLVRAWHATQPDDEEDYEDEDPRGEGIVLVPIRGVEPAYDFLRIDKAGCEVWHGSDEEYPTQVPGTLDTWLSARLAVSIAQLARAEAEVPRLHTALEAVDFTDPRAAFETIYRVEPRIVREAYYPLAALRAGKLAELVARTPRKDLDRELADRIAHELYDKHHWALVTAFGGTDEQLGVAYWKQARPAEALPCFERCLDAKPFHLANVARCLLVLGRTDEALRAARGCIGTDTLTRDIVGQVELAAGNTRAAEDAFAAAIAAQQGSFGRYAEPFVHLAALYLDQGRLDAATRVFADDYTVAWLASRVEFHQLLARLADARGDHEAVAIARAQAAGPDLETWQS